MRFSEAVNKDNNTPKESKETKQEKEIKDMKREMHTNRRVTKLLGTGRKA